MPPPRSYTPIRRLGARAQWPPDDSWSIADLAAEMAFWRNYSALRSFSGPRRVPTVSVPSPRPHQDRIDALTRSAFSIGRRHPPTARRPPHGLA